MTPLELGPTSPPIKTAAIGELQKQIQLAREFAKEAKANLIKVSPLLTKAISTGSGQGRRLESLLWSCWNGDHKVGLCDAITGLDSKLAQAALALLAARAHMAGEADPLLQKIIEDSGSQPPTPNNNPIQ